MEKRRIGEDFKYVWGINWNGVPEDFSDTLEMVLTASIFGKRVELERDVDYVVDGNLLKIDFTPKICTISGIYNLELNYVKPSDGFIDGERRSAVDIDAFQLVPKSAQITATGGITGTSDAIIGFYGLSAYEVWLKDNPESTKEDYYNWLRQPATDAVSLFDGMIEHLDEIIDSSTENESERVTAEALRLQSEAIRISAETERKSNEVERLANESSRASDELIRKANESSRKQDEATRKTNENERETAELTRQSSESERNENEGLRVNAESLRATAETSRETAESLRVEAELLRQSSTQEAISDAENATENANTAAQNADDARLAIQSDLGAKAFHGYDSSPKTLKEVEDEVVQLKEDTLSLINVDSKYPLSAGNYTLQTALNAIPQNNRILGQRITFNASGGFFKTYKFAGSSLTNTYYLNPIYWEEIENESLFAFGDSVTENEKNYLGAFKAVALKGDWKGKELYIRGVNQLSDADGLKVKGVNIAYDTSGVHTQIASIRVTYDTDVYGIKRYDFTFGSSYSGYIIVDTALLHRRNISLGSIPASKAELVNIIDLNDYASDIPEIPKASKTSFGIVKIGDGLRIGEDGELQTTPQGSDSSVSQKPYPSKLTFELMDDDGKTVAHLSKDGKVIYATRVSRVMQSTDEGVTWDTVIYSPNSINVNAVRELEDGEILFSTRNLEGVKGKIYKTIGYKRDDLTNVTAKEVLECMGINGHIFNTWGLDVYENIVVASEYGLQGDTGARYAYLSTDYGDTFNMIFDQKITTQSIVGAAPHTTSAHIHTIHYDRYMDRIWIVCGDQNSTGAYYSDDLGITWGVCTNSVGINAMQFTGINSYPEGVFFGTDRHPDGVWFWERGPKEDIPEIKPYYLIPREEYRTFVFGRAFRRYAEKDEITFFVGSADAIVADTMGGVVVAYKGTKGISTLITLPDDIPNVWGVSCVGVTHGGYIVVSGTNRANSNQEIYRAKAPVWE